MSFLKNMNEYDLNDIFRAGSALRMLGLSAVTGRPLREALIQLDSNFPSKFMEKLGVSSSTVATKIGPTAINSFQDKCFFSYFCDSIMCIYKYF